MDRLLRPDRFDADPNATDAAESWEHWFFTFTNFLDIIDSHKPDRLKTLIHFLSPSVYKLVCRCPSYESAVSTLQSLYVQPKNEVFARHLLATCKQAPTENLDQFIQRLRALARDCNFKPVSAEQNQDDAIRDAFISGLSSNTIRQRLLEHKSLDIRAAFDQAKSLDLAEKQSHSFASTIPIVPCNAGIKDSVDRKEPDASSPPDAASAAARTKWTGKCFFCGHDRHPRYKCPARDSTCKSCGKKGHFQKVCRSDASTKHAASASPFVVSSIITAAAPACLAKAITEVVANGIKLKALVDTGSSESFVCEAIVQRNRWSKLESHSEIVLASTQLSSHTKGHCFVSLIHKGTSYPHVKLSILPDLCTDILLGHDFLKLHESVEIPFQGNRPPFSLCGLSAAQLPLPTLFAHLSSSCNPIRTKSRRFTPSDESFIRTEVDRLLREGIIEPSKSPWRAQVLVTTNERQKKRMVIDYSQTINRYTQLDAYPLPRIDDLIERISHFGVFSTLDLESAYHQISVREDEKKYTAFEACNNLYQFCRIPFGVTNGVACFQRTMDELIRREKLQGTFVYVDNITVCGKDAAEHDENLRSFLRAAEKYGLTLNRKKCIFAAKEIRLLGYEVSLGTVKPDPDRFKPLMMLPPPLNLKSQQRVVGMFAYYSQWFSHFSDKIYPLVHNKVFPLPKSALDAYEALKAELIEAAVISIDRNVPLVVETDASEVAISATLNQNGRPVAFFSRTLTTSERHHSAVEKEAYAIVEAIRKWRHYLLGTHFKLITDQRSVAFMYNTKMGGKIKNDKIQRWRIELSQFSYDVIYRPGTQNSAADTLSRAYCANTNTLNDLKRIHETLCHPGITRLFHFVRAKNLPYSLENIKSITQQCSVCLELKPKFYKPETSPLIKATQPLERLSMDFKGPIPSASRNRYILTVIDEYSRFPFAYACPDMTASTIISRLTELFSIFGMPSYVHSDRGSSFMSEELKSFLHERGVATSRTTSYNPQCNGQVERLNATLWRSVSLCLRSRNLAVEQWEYVLPEALHSIRSLLCTATNATPHERMFLHNRKSPVGVTLPQWLLTPGPVLLRRNTRSSKYDSLVEEVDLLECNPEYAHVRFPDGREDTVSLRHLAPKGAQSDYPEILPLASTDSTTSPETQSITPESSCVTHDNPPDPSDIHANTDNLLIQQQRTRPYYLRNREA